MKKYRIRPDKKHTLKRYSIIFGTIVFLAAIVLLFLEITDKTYLFHDKPSKVSETTADSPTKGEQEKKKQSSNTGDNKSDSEPQTPRQAGDSKQQDATTADTQLVAPYGQFVSSHRISKDGVISSVCTTTAGASCQIIFTKDGDSRSLDRVTTDKAGSAYWNWKPEDIGLTAGAWKITAKAILGSQTETSHDALMLEIKDD